MTEERVGNHNTWYIAIPLLALGILACAPEAREAAGFTIAFILLSSILLVIPLTICRIVWKTFKWAWSR